MACEVWFLPHFKNEETVAEQVSDLVKITSGTWIQNGLFYVTLLKNKNCVDLKIRKFRWGTQLDLVVLICQTTVSLVLKKKLDLNV